MVAFLTCVQAVFGWKRSCVCLLWQRKTCLYIWSVGLQNQHGGVVFSGNLNEHNENGIHPPNLISLIHKVYFHTQNVVFTSDWRSWQSSCMGWGSVNVFVSPCGVFVVSLLFLTSLCVFMFVHTAGCHTFCSSAVTSCSRSFPNFWVFFQLPLSSSFSFPFLCVLTVIT